MHLKIPIYSGKIERAKFTRSSSSKNSNSNEQRALRAVRRARGAAAHGKFDAASISDVLTDSFHRWAEDKYFCPGQPSVDD